MATKLRHRDTTAVHSYAVRRVDNAMPYQASLVAWWVVHVPTNHIPGINFVGSSLTKCMPVGTHGTDQRKAPERELATFDENRRPLGMLNPMHAR